MNETLEARVADALAERKVLADIVEGTNAFVQVADKDFRWIAINGAAAREFQRIFGILPRVGDNMLELLRCMPQHQAAVRSVWQRALAGEEFVEIGVFGDRGRDRRHYEMRFNTLRDARGNRSVPAICLRRHGPAGRAGAVAGDGGGAQASAEDGGGRAIDRGIAHDFNNMLAVIMSSLRLAQRRMERGDFNIQGYITGALGGAERAANLVARLLAFSRQHPLSPQQTDTNRLLSGMEECCGARYPKASAWSSVRAGGL